MLLGLPEGLGELVPGQALPLESSMDVHGGGKPFQPTLGISALANQTVDFRKGCYLGQELTVRTYHTGATRKRVLPIRLFPLSNPTASLDQYTSPTSLQEVPSGSKTGTRLDVTYHPSKSSASQRPKSAGKILTLYPTVSSVGLGLVRLEFAERTWWTAPLREGATVQDYMDGETGRLSASIGGEEWGVYVGKGEAFAAASASLQELDG